MPDLCIDDDDITRADWKGTREDSASVRSMLHLAEFRPTDNDTMEDSSS